jgi:hypothetical protein
MDAPARHRSRMCCAMFRHPTPAIRRDPCRSAFQAIDKPTFFR